MLLDVIKKILASFATVWFFFADLFAPAAKVQIPAPPAPMPTAGETAWAATDGLGRTLPLHAETGGEKERFVGLFYWTWHVSHAKWVQNPLNVNDTLEAHPEALHDVNYPGWAAFGVPNHWNEPLYGYYDTDDRWVLRRHAELLAAAGVDVIIFDNTNGTATWKDSYDTLFEVFAEARADGVNTPQIAFLLPFFSEDDTVTQLRSLYTDIYQAGRYQDLWFYWKGKPLIMANPDALRDLKDAEAREIAAFFTFRPGIAPYNRDSDDMRGENVFQQAFNRNTYWSWLSVYPQVVNRTPDGKAEEMAVSVAQNWSAELGLTAMNGANVFGRTYTSGGYDTRENAVLYGANFAEQAARALEADPEFVFITGWNEWVAGRFEEWCGVTNAFPDECNDAFSRDIEPTKGKLKDHYYYQMVDFIRRYKGTAAPAVDTKRATIRAAADWETAGLSYVAFANNTFDRDDVGYGGIRYTETGGRNDIAAAKAASDAENVYFYVRCKDEITPATDRNWMRLLLSVPGAAETWEGYSHIVNRVSPAGNAAVLERSKGGWNWEKAADVTLTVDGDCMWIAIPKAALGITGDSFTVDFKWTDNTLSAGDIMDVYVTGDTAPVGRFNYRYRFAR